MRYPTREGGTHAAVARSRSFPEGQLPHFLETEMKPFREMSLLQRQVYQAVRNYALTMNEAEMRREVEISRERGDEFRAQCFEALIAEERK